VDQKSTSQLTKLITPPCLNGTFANIRVAAIVDGLKKAGSGSAAATSLWKFIAGRLKPAQNPNLG
jgi:hypothetical protein